MNERPILFSGAMVRAILDGRKTQTRRVVKPQPFQYVELSEMPNTDPLKGWQIPGRSFVWWDDDTTSHRWRCPYGQPGDRLWVKETFSPWADEFTKSINRSKDKAVYRADYRNGCPSLDVGGFKHWKPSIFMPRWASRITLEITDTRAERLNNISEADYIAEGVEKVDHGWKAYDHPTEQATNYTAIDSYRSLWEKINGVNSWKVNPYVWCLSFKRL